MSGGVRVTRMSREAAASLGNTEKVCRRSCIHPGVFRAFAQGKVVQHSFVHAETTFRIDRAASNRSERALLNLLKLPA